MRRGNLHRSRNLIDDEGGGLLGAGDLGAPACTNPGPGWSDRAPRLH